MAGTSDDNSSHAWIKEAHEVGEVAWNALSELPDSYPLDLQYSANEYHQMAQNYMFNYYRYFAPRENQLGGDLDLKNATEEDLKASLWWEPLSTVPIPVSGQSVRLNGEAELINDDSVSDKEVLARVWHRIPTKKQTVRLGNLKKFHLSEATLYVHVHGWIENDGRQNDTVKGTYRLPPAAIYDVLFQLDRCLAKAGGIPHFGLNKRPYDDWREEFEDGVYTGPEDVNLPHKNVQE